MELTKEYIQNLRQDYRSAGLTEGDVDKDPITQFGKWFKEAIEAQLFEPNVMTLATADQFGKPSARVMLLKGFDENGFVFYTNYDSRKGKMLTANPQVALVFFWPELERQVRIEGVISKVDEETSTSYFHSRPKGSQIGALASTQSSIIADKTVIEERVKVLTEEFNDKEVPRPNYWGGYLVEPTYLEFWQGGSSRLHDRLVYEKVDGAWAISRLAP